MDEQQRDYPLNANELTLTEQRALIFQLLYTLYAFDYDISLEAIADSYNRGFEVEIPPESNVFKTVHAVAHDRDILDQKIIPLIENWRFDRLGVPTILILRLAVWELMHTDTDPAVIINEAVELAKSFGEKDSFKFINGILDQFVKQAE
jgi:transcription antitermination protein NusB